MAVTVRSNWNFRGTQKKRQKSCVKIWLPYTLRCKSLSIPISLGPPLCNFFSKLSNFQKTKVVDFGKSDEGIFGDFQ
jgi:hypothetical protein